MKCLSSVVNLIAMALLVTSCIHCCQQRILN